MDFDVAQSLVYFRPELILAATLVAVATLDRLGRGNEQALGALALVGTATSIYALSGLSGWGEGWLFGRWLVVDALALFFKLLVALGALCVLWMAADSREIVEAGTGRSYALILAATLGMFLMISAASLTMAWLAVELVRLALLHLGGAPGRRRESGEGGSAARVRGAPASAAILCASAWIFGFAGSLDYGRIHGALRAYGAANAPALTLVLALLLGGLGFKIFTVADRAAPIPLTAFVSVCAKAAGIAMIVRFVYVALSEPVAAGVWEPLAGVDGLTFAAVASVTAMTVGNLAAARQRSLKRMLAYGSVAQAGYLLLGFVRLGDGSLQVMLFYAMADCAMILGAFLVAMIVAGESERDDLSGVHGLARRRGGLLPSLALAVFLLSLAGLPPLAGFVGRYPLVAALAGEGLDLLFFAVLLNCLATFECHARILAAMFLDRPPAGTPRLAVDGYGGLLAALLAAVTIGAGVHSEPLLDFAARSMRFFQG